MTSIVNDLSTIILMPCDTKHPHRSTSECLQSNILLKLSTIPNIYESFLISHRHGVHSFIHIIVSNIKHILLTISSGHPCTDTSNMTYRVASEIVWWWFIIIIFKNLFAIIKHNRNNFKNCIDICWSKIKIAFFMLGVNYQSDKIAVTEFIRINRVC